MSVQQICSVRHVASTLIVKFCPNMGWTAGHSLVADHFISDRVIIGAMRPTFLRQLEGSGTTQQSKVQ